MDFLAAIGDAIWEAWGWVAMVVLVGVWRLLRFRRTSRKRAV